MHRESNLRRLALGWAILFVLGSCYGLVCLSGSAPVVGILAAIVLGWGSYSTVYAVKCVHWAQGISILATCLAILMLSCIIPAINGSGWIFVAVMLLLAGWTLLRWKRTPHPKA